MAYYLLLYRGKPRAAKSRAADFRDKWSGFIREISNSIIEGDQDVMGYTIVQASDIDEAVELSRGAPPLHKGGRADVYQIMDTAA